MPIWSLSTNGFWSNAKMMLMKVERKERSRRRRLKRKSATVQDPPNDCRTRALGLRVRLSVKTKRPGFAKCGVINQSRGHERMCFGGKLIYRYKKVEMDSSRDN